MVRRAVFAPQKGADEAQVRRLERGLCHLNDLWKKEVGQGFFPPWPEAARRVLWGPVWRPFSAAGCKRGIDVVLDSAGFDRILQDTDLVITGEGNLDSQSLHGKTVSGVARRGQGKKCPCIGLWWAARR